MKLQSLNEIASTLSKAGYITSESDTAVFVDLLHDGKEYPAVLQIQDDSLHITCQLSKLSEFEQDQLSLVAVNALAVNVEILPFAFAIIKPSQGAQADANAVAESPIVLINSVPMKDLSPEELLWEVSKLQTALLAGCSAISAAVAVSDAA